MSAVIDLSPGDVRVDLLPVDVVRDAFVSAVMRQKIPTKFELRGFDQSRHATPTEKHAQRQCQLEFQSRAWVIAAEALQQLETRPTSATHKE